MEKTMKGQSCDGYGNFMNTMKEMQPMTYFSCDLSGTSNLLDWQLKLDSGIEVIIEGGIICHSGHFYEGTKSCYFLIVQQSTLSAEASGSVLYLQHQLSLLNCRGASPHHKRVTLKEEWLHSHSRKS